MDGSNKYFTLQVYISIHKAVKAAQTVTGDMFRRKKVKEKRPSPFLFHPPKLSSTAVALAQACSEGGFAPQTSYRGLSRTN